MEFSDLPVGASFILPHQKWEGPVLIKVAEKRYQLTVKRKGEPETYSYTLGPRAAVLQVEVDAAGMPIIPPAYDHIDIADWGKGKTPINWIHYGKRIKWNGIKLTIDPIGSSRTTRTSKVILDEGEWPADVDLMVLCDGRTPVPEGKHPGIFGGSVTKNDREAQVTVYID